MVMHIINYAIRGFIFVLGIILLSGILPVAQSGDLMLRGIGLIMILFGALRVITYYQATHRFRAKDYSVDNTDEDSEEDED